MPKSRLALFTMTVFVFTSLFPLIILLDLTECALPQISDIVLTTNDPPLQRGDDRLAHFSHPDNNCLSLTF
jgi:hypothetical protein